MCGSNDLQYKPVIISISSSLQQGFLLEAACLRPREENLAVEKMLQYLSVFDVRDYGE